MVRLLVPKPMITRRGCMISTAAGMVTAEDRPTKFSHFRLVICCTPMLTTPMLLSMVV